MSFQYQICGLIIIVLIHVIYSTHKRLMLRSERVFSRALRITTGMLILDILKVLAIQNMDTLPLNMIKGMSKIYEGSIILCSGIVLVYLMANILKKEAYNDLNKTTLAVLLAEIVLAAVHTTHIDPRGFSYGPAINVGYVIVGVNFLVTLFFLIKNIEKVERRRRFGILLWIAMWVALVLTQRYVPHIMLSSLAVALGVLILFVLLEKPESKLDKEYGCFNYFALLNYLDEMLEIKAPIHLMSVSLKSSGTLTGAALYKEASHALSVMERIPGVWVFRGIGQDFIAIARTKEAIDDLGKELEREAALIPYISKLARFVRSDNCSIFNNAVEVLSFLSFAKTCDNEKSRIFTTNDSLVEAYHNRKQLEIELNNALIENRIETFIQPIYSVHDKRISSGEALARIRTRDGKILMPSDFIPVAEQNGSISELGYKIFEQTCEFISKNMDLLDYIEINLSVVQCEDEGLSQKLIEIMDRYHVPPQKINLEITETASIVTKQKLLKNMERMLEHGVTFSLDDFGKGESNLMYMVDMPVSIVKLDFDMSKSYFKNDKAKYVVNAVEGMSHGLNMKLVAEGIETEEELRAMEKQRVDYIQGYYFSRPLPQDEFVDFVQNYNANRDMEAGNEKEDPIEKFRPA